MKRILVIHKSHVELLFMVELELGKVKQSRPFPCKLRSYLEKLAITQIVQEFSFQLLLEKLQVS